MHRRPDFAWGERRGPQFRTRRRTWGAARSVTRQDFGHPFRPRPKRAPSKQQKHLSRHFRAGSSLEASENQVWAKEVLIVRPWLPTTTQRLLASTIVVELRKWMSAPAPSNNCFFPVGRGCWPMCVFPLRARIIHPPRHVILWRGELPTGTGPRLHS